MGFHTHIIQGLYRSVVVGGGGVVMKVVMRRLLFCQKVCGCGGEPSPFTYAPVILVHTSVFSCGVSIFGLLKYYSPVVAEGKTFVLVFCV